MSKVIVIGGGVVGLCTAYYLRKKGHEVTILDKGAISDSCSFGNAGMIVPSHFVPLAAPGMIKQGIRWMFNSKSPFYVRPSFNMNLMRWGVKFVKHASAKHVEQSAIPLRDLSLLSKKLYQDLAKNPDLNFELTTNGILAFYKTEKAAEEEAELAKKAIELGLDMAVLNAEECKALQPDLELNVLGAVHYRCDAHLYPTQLMNGLLRYLNENGVQIIKNTLVEDIVFSGNRITKVIAGDTAWEADEYVIAAGSWSPALARMANIELSIMPGKGYSFMELEPQNRLTIPALLCEARVAITPMDGKIRYGGTMELDQINSRVNIARVKGIVESVPDYFPDLNPLIPSEKDIWYGFRPSSPDGLPYIGRSRKHHNLVFATGHGMMGLSLAPATGLLVSQIISGEQTDLNLSPFTVDR
ncbi:FAD-binding oxidoreductase [Pedobacter foliorum]|uniref:NAD(P)/FAD-dependent oxidoreductase n=1 Tax=Pedobacter foliorum TaxID=2739058 RepID=UPI0015662880|nr:FAD-dependent oxidoreductase [Pedobacter foliorum]NRF37474.1 FAD-dependent oxidoreductase [Pedobacter foliorum]